MLITHLIISKELLSDDVLDTQKAFCLFSMLLQIGARAVMLWHPGFLHKHQPFVSVILSLRLHFSTFK